MITETQVREAKNPQEAMLAIAKALDRIEDYLEEQRSESGGWDAWTPTEPSEPSGAGDKKELADADTDDLEDDERNAVLAARARLAQDEPGQFIKNSLEAGNQVKSNVSRDGIEVELPPVDDQRKEQRYKFAKKLAKLHETYPQLGEQAVDAYVKGGPMWLYLSDRDYVMQMPPEWKQIMILDVENDSPKDARNMSRDILKDMSAPGPDITAEAILGG